MPEPVDRPRALVPALLPAGPTRRPPPARVRAISIDPPPERAAGPGRRPTLARGSLLALALVALAGHVVVNIVGPYGLHRDELLYLAMGRHLRFWAMDFPPGIGLVAEISRGLLGESRAALRMGPAVAHAFLVVLAGVLAQVMHGHAAAQRLAAGAVLLSPLFLRTGAMLQPVVFDQVTWTLALLALALIGRAQAEREAAQADARSGTPRPIVTPVRPHEQVWHTPDGRRQRAPRGQQLVERLGTLLVRAGRSSWLLLGAAIGIGLLFKFSIAFVGLGVAVAFLATPLRRWLATSRPWSALAVAVALGAPSVVGQLRLGWPVAGQMRDLQASQLVHVGIGEFLGGQLLLGPAVLLAALGLVGLFATPRLRPVRGVGVACLVAFLVLLALRGKAYYAGPLYPALFAAGAVIVEHGRLRARRGGSAPRGSRSSRWRFAAAWGAIGVYGLATLPFGLPILPPAPMARYAEAMGIGAATATNTGEQLALPQDYADMLGWPQLASEVGRLYQQLPEEARANAALLAGNYGQAGALEHFGPHVGLPPVVSPAGSWWFFGPGDRVGDPIVTVGVPASELAGRCGQLRTLGVVRHELTPWLVPEERDVPVLVCERPVQSVRELWPSLAGRN